MLRTLIFHLPLVFQEKISVRGQITKEVAPQRQNMKSILASKVCDFNRWVNKVKEVIKTEPNSFKLTTPYINEGWRAQLQSIPPSR